MTLGIHDGLNFEKLVVGVELKFNRTDEGSIVCQAEGNRSIAGLIRVNDLDIPCAAFYRCNTIAGNLLKKLL